MSAFTAHCLLTLPRLVLVSAIACLFVTPLGASTLTIATVSENPGKQYRELKPMVDYVAEHMSDLGVTGGRVVLASNENELVEMMRAGQVDWVTETAFTAMKLEDQANARVLLRKWKRGVAEYSTVIFARKDSGFRTLDDLVGHSFAFEDPGSTSAYYMPFHALRKRGLTLEPLRSLRDEPPVDAIGYLFSREEINSAVWVQKGLVSAAAMSDADWEQPAKMPSTFRKDMMILHETAPIPRALEAVRGDMDEAMIDRLESVLLGMPFDPSAVQVLFDYGRTTQFDRIDDTLDASLDELRQLIPPVRGTRE